MPARRRPGRARAARGGERGRGPLLPLIAFCPWRIGIGYAHLPRESALTSFLALACWLLAAGCGPNPPAQAPAEPSTGQDAAAPAPVRDADTDPAFATEAPLVRGPRPVATGGRAVDVLAWAGGWLVGADARGLESVLLLWEDPEKAPRELARVPGRVQGLLPTPDGQSVAVEAAYPRDPEVWDSEDPASVVLLEIATGRVRSLLGATEPLSLERACWSPDGARLAVPALERGQAPPFVRYTRVVDATTGHAQALREPGNELRPLRWDADGLLLVGGGAPPRYLRWAGTGAALEKAATPAWTSPDGAWEVRPHAGGLLVRRRALERLFQPAFPGDQEALAGWGTTRPPAWAGPHRLALQIGGEVLALDLATLRWRPLSEVSTGLPKADGGGHRLVLAAGATPWWGWSP
ncbi:MAG: hypothetical protein ABIO70_06155 [Pseudomonadota bacterium]